MHFWKLHKPGFEQSTQHSEHCLFFYMIFRFTDIATAVTNMENKDLDNKNWG